MIIWRVLLQEHEIHCSCNKQNIMNIQIEFYVIQNYQ